MKRVLSWLVLVACYIAFSIILKLDMALLAYVLDLYGSLSAFLKLIVLFVGGSCILGIAIAPLVYGIPLMHEASEAVYPSKKGLRYTVFGIYIAFCTILEIVFAFQYRDIFFAILAIAMIIIGHNTRKEYAEK